MDTARQAIRWSIPGAVLLTAVLVIVDLPSAAGLAWDHITGSSLRPDPVLILGPITAGQAALAALATIPISFILYQFYYWRYEKVSPVPFLCIVPGDRGWEALHPAIVKDATLQDALQNLYGVRPTSRTHLLRPPTETARRPLFVRLKGPECRPSYARKCHANWNLVKQLLLHDVTGHGALASESKALSDLYHSLGATRAAVFLAGALTIPLTWLSALESPAFFIIACIVFDILALLLVAAALTTASMVVLLQRWSDPSYDRPLGCLGVDLSTTAAATPRPLVG